MRIPISSAHLRHDSHLRATSVPSREHILQPQQPRVLREERPRKKQRTTRTLLIDNYDSYTYNLFQLISKVTGEKPAVIQNDELSWRDLSKKLHQRQFQNVVISPGPGTPLHPSDLGVCGILLEEAEDVPILGVCLGMQALAHVHGGKVVQAAEPIHGRLSQVRHDGSSLFQCIPSGCGNGFEVVRYHSLAVLEESLPACLEATAWTCGQHHAVSLSRTQSEGPSDELAYGHEAGDKQLNVLMGIAHRSRPHWGVQFHPESVATRYGDTLMRNFFANCEQHADEVTASEQIPGALNLAELGLQSRESVQAEPLDGIRLRDNLDVRWQVLRGALNALGGSENVFWSLFGTDGTSDTFWLDSASMDGQRYSYMGGKGGPLWQRLVFNLAPSSSREPGLLTMTNAQGEQESIKTSFLDYIEAQLVHQRCANSEQLPFEFTGGFVGYLGYEIRAECDSPGSHDSPHPDAAMFFADRHVVIDHATDDVFLVALHEQHQSAVDQADDWLQKTAAQLRLLRNQAQMPDKSQALRFKQRTDPERSSRPGASPARPLKKLASGDQWQTILSPAGNLESRKNRDAYIADVTSCLDSLRRGDSYELCLTTQLRKKVKISPEELYSRLRASNPSAHAAWLSFGSSLPTICCSSPERFLKGSADGVVEARPIKGTTRRYLNPQLDEESKATLLSSAKARAENLMIVDLLRNDLGRVCEVGSVHVPGLMELETYSTVHNLVSTVRGRLKQGSSAVDCLKACFPGGSMTGAPKRRSMEILGRLENGPRGVYSGCLGFIGLNNTFDLNIVIRTAVVSDDEVTVGAGGAIVLQSDPEDEYEEMMLKASALMAAIDKCTLL